MAAFLGIEIREHEILAALVKTNVTGRAMQSVRYLREDIRARAALPRFAQAEDGSLYANDASSEHSIGEAVERLLQRVRADLPDLVMAMSGLDGTVRRVSIPVAVQKKLDELLPFEIESQLPFDLDEGVLDHQAIGTSDGKVHVLAVALPKETIAAQLARWSDIGLDPERVSLGAVAFAGLSLVAASVNEDVPTLIVFGTQGHVEVGLMRAGKVEFARSFRVHGDISKTFSYASESEAALHRDLRQTLISLRTQCEITPERLVVLGTLAPQAASLASVLELELHSLTIPAEKTSGKSKALDVVSVFASSEDFAYALSLAALPLVRTKCLEFRKGDFKKVKSASVRKQYGTLIAVAAIAVLGSFFYSTAAKWWALSSRRNDLADQLAVVTREVLGDETRDVARARRLLESGRERVDPLPSFTAYDALQAISNAVPSTIVGHNVQKLEIDLGDDASGGHFELSGTVATIEESERIRNAITPDETCLRTATCATRCFREIEMGPSTQTPEGRRLYRVEGTILCPEQAAQRPTKNRRTGTRRPS